MMLTQRQIQHIFLRAGFGSSFEQVVQVQGKTKEQIVENLLKAELSELIVSNESEVSMAEFSMLSGREKVAMRKSWKDLTRQLNIKWIQEMATSEKMLGEKMCYFWHDHFACSSNNVFYLEDYFNRIRKHALGNFRDLLNSIAKSPAMLLYLNNQQNKKQAPNENFGREVMELFTLGGDNGYTEFDIREAARAFTGWGVAKTGHYHFRKNMHDFGEKKFLGNTGRFGGEEILEILLQNKKTARFIASKLVEFFFADKNNEILIHKVSDSLYNSNYDIKSALKVLFCSEEFFNPTCIGNKIKSPIELIAGIQRMVRVTIESEQTLVYMQKVLGQKLFFPPNVAGWNNGRSWIDNNTLAFRLQLPNYLFKAATINYIPDESADMFDQFKLRGGLKQLQAKLNMEKLEEEFKKASNSEFLEFFIQPLNMRASPIVSKNPLLNGITNLTILPEFQLC